MKYGRDLMRAALLAAIVVLIAALPVAGCGGDDDPEGGGDAAATAPAQTTEATPDGDGGGDQGGGSKAGSGAGAGDAEGSGGGSDSPVDLTTAPEKIPGAVVTGRGAVQTLPPSSKAQQTAQKNSYSSIKAFGEEAEGEEATDITFALVQYLTAKADADWSLACARLYSPLVPGLKELGAGTQGSDPAQIGCPEAFAAAMEGTPRSVLAEQAKIDVSSVRRGEEDRAFVIYKTPATLSADMPMFLEDGTWKVGAVEAYALTPDQTG